MDCNMKYIYKKSFGFPQIYLVVKAVNFPFRKVKICVFDTNTMRFPHKVEMGIDSALATLVNGGEDMMLNILQKTIQKAKSKEARVSDVYDNFIKMQSLKSMVNIDKEDFKLLKKM